MTGPRRGLVVAAPQSGSGKTVFTLGLLRALRRSGISVASAKSGPDYIDPGFHTAASGAPCVNLDAWAMDGPSLRSRAYRHTPPGGLLVVEGAMGLFDGAADGTGSTADLAATLDLPVLLVVDASRQAQSIGALVRGFAAHRPDVPVAGLILNRVGSPRHEGLLRQGLGAAGLPVAGVLSNQTSLSLPSRHLGLVQASENRGLEAFLDAAGQKVAAETDLGRDRQNVNAACRHRALCRSASDRQARPSRLHGIRRFPSPIHTCCRTGGTRAAA